uniref:Salivary secreted peptide n=1 Tax=Bracon brevicornis TaxID=1563983 RepID=A0A6V7IV41_9HYME
MYSKCALTVAFLAAIILSVYTPSEALASKPLAANNTNNSHHLIVGSRLPGDRLTYQENIIKSSSLWQVTTVEKTFKVPVRERITQVQALDQKTNGNGAYAKIIKGGPGFGNVTIQFKSQRNHGINFKVNLYSKY